MRIWRLFVDRLPDLRTHIEEHQTLIAAIVATDADQARAIARQHVRGFEEAVRILL
jgi:DNA-binding GntR family transcriptional regulator